MAKGPSAKPKAAPDAPGHGWQKGSPSHVIADVKRLAAGERKCRLFCVACCRLVSKHITHPDCLTLIDLAEACADDPAVRGEMAKLQRRVRRWANAIHPSYHSDQDWYARAIAPNAAVPTLLAPVSGFVDKPAFRDLLGEVYGPRAGPVGFDPGWRTSAAVAIATRMYESRDFGPMSILADALQDAGCDNETILNHCRGPGPHVRGCWVVDQVLGKA